MTRTQPHNEDYAWLLDALGGPGRSTPTPALARPSADRPELFVPLGSRRSGIDGAAGRRTTCRTSGIVR